MTKPSQINALNTRELSLYGIGQTGGGELICSKCKDILIKAKKKKKLCLLSNCVLASYKLIAKYFKKSCKKFGEYKQRVVSLYQAITLITKTKIL